MSKPYTRAEILKILNYAAEYGVVQAARHFKVQRPNITRWNKKYHVYTPQTAVYPMEKRMEILRHAARHGIRAASKHFGVSTGIIELWNKTLKVYAPTKRKFSKENKIEILQYARDYGVAAAADKYDVSAPTIIEWNNALHVYALKRPYSKQEKIEILNFARDNGVAEAERAFDLPATTISRWNKELHIYTPQKPVDYKNCTETEKKQILQYAKKLYDSMAEHDRSANHVFIIVAEEYGITKDQLRKWNERYNIVPLRPRKKKAASLQIISEAQAALDSSRGHVTRASRRSGISVDSIKKMQTDKQIAFSRAKRRITTNPPVGRKKARLISGIIAALQRSKE